MSEPVQALAFIDVMPTLSHHKERMNVDFIILGHLSQLANAPTFIYHSTNFIYLKVMVRDFFPSVLFVPRRASAVTHLVLVSDTLSDLCLIGSWKLKLFLFYGGVSLRVNAEPL